MISKGTKTCKSSVGIHIQCFPRLFLWLGHPLLVLGMEKGEGSDRLPSAPFPKSEMSFRPHRQCPSQCTPTTHENALHPFLPMKPPCGGLCSKGGDTIWSTPSFPKCFCSPSPAPHSEVVQLVPRLDICQLACSEELQSYSSSKQSRLDIPRRWTCPRSGPA